MKLFVLTTKSESGDDYTYCIKHTKMPTVAELRLFLSINACDTDDSVCYEYIVECNEISAKAALPIPKDGKLLEFM